MSRLTRVLAVGASVAVAIGAAAPPAAAHGLGGLRPSNYETRLLRVTPAVSGLEVRVVDLGTRLQVINSGRGDVVVLGYDDEPYLRVGPRGVFENRRSPSVTLNRSLDAAGPLPRSADSSAAPRWHRISDGRRAAWHDHRAHYTGTDEPPIVRRDPGHRHRVQTWKVAIETADGRVTARGDVVWVPGPSPWPFVAFAVVVGAVVLLLTRTPRWRAVMAAGLGALIALEAVHLVGSWGASSAGAATRLADNIYSIAGILVGLAALAWMRRRGRDAAAPTVLVAAIVLVVVGGLTDLTALGHSQVPTTLGESSARLVIALVLGVGAGLVAGAGARLRLPPPA